jgi:hypothetical protein
VISNQKHAVRVVKEEMKINFPIKDVDGEFQDYIKGKQGKRQAVLFALPHQR